MYESYWKLKEKPFENTPDPRFMYYSKKHEEALTRLLYGIKEEKGAVMLTGEYGSGKTVLSRIVIDNLANNKNYEIAIITHPQLTPVQFIQEILYQLTNENRKAPKPQLIHELQDVIYKNFRDGKKTVIIIDEAQLIKNKEAFEELRLILNFQLNDRFLVTLVLIGQPELMGKVSAIPQLQQRLGVKYHLTALDRRDADEYIGHRLGVAGQAIGVFTPEALDVIYRYSGGTPRKINNICDMGLLMGFGKEKVSIDGEFMDSIAQDLDVGVHSYA